MRMNLYVRQHLVQGMSWLNIMQQRKDLIVFLHIVNLIYLTLWILFSKLPEI